MSRLRSEHLPVRYCKRPSQIFLGAAPLGDRVSVARYRFVSVSLSQAQCCGGYIDYSGVLAVLKFPLLQSSSFIISASTSCNSTSCTTPLIIYTLFQIARNPIYSCFAGNLAQGLRFSRHRRVADQIWGVGSWSLRWLYGDVLGAGARKLPAVFVIPRVER